MTSAGPSSREVLFELLYVGLIEIRAASGGGRPMTEEDRAFVNAISNVLHNLPSRLAKATTDGDFDHEMRELWRWRTRRDVDWLRDRLERLGVDTAGLG